MAIGATHIDHIVIRSTDSAATAAHFSRLLAAPIRRTMTRPGTGAHLEFMKFGEIILEFAGPPQPEQGEPRAQLAGFVLCVRDIHAAVAELRAHGIPVGDPKPAVQPGALIATLRGGTHGVPLAIMQYDALPTTHATEKVMP